MSCVSWEQKHHHSLLTNSTLMCLSLSLSPLCATWDPGVSVKYTQPCPPVHCETHKLKHWCTCTQQHNWCQISFLQGGTPFHYNFLARGSNPGVFNRGSDQDPWGVLRVSGLANLWVIGFDRLYYYTNHLDAGIPILRRCRSTSSQRLTLQGVVTL